MRELTQHKMARLISEHLTANDIMQAELARRAGVTEKHVSRVLLHHQTAAMATLDYWAFVLGLEWRIELQAAA